MSQISHIGDDGWNIVSNYLDRCEVQSVLLVTGKSMFSISGAEAKLAPLLDGKRTRRVCEFETNPKSNDVRRILTELSHDEPYDMILAVGGGSVIDVSKLLKAFWNSSDPVDAYLAGKEALVPAEIPLIALPSTAGSGSEATHFAVVYQGREKFSVAGESLRPDLAAVMPSLLKSTPSPIAASSGMDALCQGIESYWSIHSTDASRALAAEAISLAWGSLEAAVNSTDSAALEQIATAAHRAGQAIDITKTTAPHAVSYALTSFFGVAHGHAVGLLVPEFLEYNMDVTELDCLDPRGVAWVYDRIHEIVTMLDCNGVDEAKLALHKLMQRIGLEYDITKLGIMDEASVNLVLNNGFNPQRVNNNPRCLSEKGLRELMNNMIKNKDLVP